MSVRRNPPKRQDDETVKASRLDYWLKVLPLITSAVSGVLVIIPQTSNLFGPFDYAAETLLIICVLGVIVFAIGLLRAKQSTEKGRQGSRLSTRLTGIALIVAAPLIAWFLWYTTLRLPPEKEEMVRKEIALGDTELRILENPRKACEHYREALLLAPRRGSIRAKLQDAQERSRTKGD